MILIQSLRRLILVPLTFLVDVNTIDFIFEHIAFALLISIKMMTVILLELFFNLVKDFLDVLNMILFSFTLSIFLLLVLTLFTLHEDDRLKGLRRRQMLFLSINEFKLFFRESGRTMIVFSICLLTSVSTRINFLHGNYRFLKLYLLLFWLSFDNDLKW